MKSKFEVGDIVEYAGVRGVVKAIAPLRGNVPVDCEFSLQKDDYYTVCFDLDGRLECWHKEPLLKLIERPVKKKVMMYPALFLAYYEYRVSNTLFYAEHDAANFFGKEFIRLLTDRGVEVEVEK